MDIDLFSIILGIIALSFFFVPVIYFEYFKKRTTKKLTSHFNDIAKTKNLNLSQVDVWSDKYAIGVDTIANQLMYLKQINGEDETLLIELHDVKSCRISKEVEGTKTQKGSQRGLKKIYLQIDFLSPEKNQEIISFYDEKNGDSVREEITLADKWSKLINSKIKKV